MLRHVQTVLQIRTRVTAGVRLARYVPQWIQTRAQILRQGVWHLLLAFATQVTQDRTEAHAPFVMQNYIRTAHSQLNVATHAPSLLVWQTQDTQVRTVTFLLLA